MPGSPPRKRASGEVTVTACRHAASAKWQVASAAHKPTLRTADYWAHEFDRANVACVEANAEFQAVSVAGANAVANDRQQAVATRAKATAAFRSLVASVADAEPTADPKVDLDRARQQVLIAISSTRERVNANWIAAAIARGGALAKWQAVSTIANTSAGIKAKWQANAKATAKAKAKAFDEFQVAARAECKAGAKAAAEAETNEI